MSTWTHVVGCIRVDGLVTLGLADKSDILKKVGPMCTYENWNDESTLPMGSEGGLQYELIEYGEGLCWLAIPIWGDLRDFDDVATIENWWKELLPKLGMVRDAVLHIHVEGRPTVILSHAA